MSRSLMPGVVRKLMIGVVAVLSVFCILMNSCTDRSLNLEEPSPWRTADVYPAWSPDSVTVAFIRKEADLDALRWHYDLWMVNVTTKERTYVRDLSALTPYGLTWDRRGEWLAFPAPTGLYKISCDGSQLIQLTSGMDYDSPSWSYTGDKIFFAINADEDAGIWSISPDGRDLTHWSDRYAVSLVKPNCFPSSDSLVVYYYNYEHSQFCLATYLPGETHIAQLLTCDLDWPATAKLSPDRSRIIAIGISGKHRLDLFGISRVGGLMEQITMSMTDRDDLGFDFSPDGSRVVYTEYLLNGGLAIMDLSDSTMQQLTPGRETDY